MKRSKGGRLLKINFSILEAQTDETAENSQSQLLSSSLRNNQVQKLHLLVVNFIFS